LRCGGGLTPVGDCRLVWRGPLAGSSSDVGETAAVVRRLPAAAAIFELNFE